MALNAYLKLTGAKTGQVKGSVIQKGRENLIMVIAVNHELLSPRDSASGLPSGRRMHKPLVITKELDKSSPILYQMLINNENITEFVLDFYKPVISAAGGIGTEFQHFTIKLTNASIVDIHFMMANNKNPDLMKYAEYEEVAFTYQKIEWTWKDGGITAQDDWKAQNA